MEAGGSGEPTGGFGRDARAVGKIVSGHQLVSGLPGTCFRCAMHTELRLSPIPFGVLLVLGWLHRCCWFLVREVRVNAPAVVFVRPSLDSQAVVVQNYTRAAFWHPADDEPLMMMNADACHSV